MSWIKINGIKSSDLGLRLIGRFDYRSSSADVDEEAVLGRDGVLLVDNRRLKPVEMEYEFTVNGDMTDKLEQISQWLDFVDWKDFELEWDSEHIYKATYISDFEINEMFRQFGKLKLSFLVHPLKRLKTGISELSVTNGIKILNPTKRVAKPIFKLTGTGNMTLTVNGKAIKFENVTDGVIIDTESRLAYWGASPRWENFVRTSEDDFPVFKLGENIISFTGATKVSVVPNWSVKI